MRISLLLSSVSQDQLSSAEDEAFYGWMHGPAAGCDGEDARTTVHRHRLDPGRLPKYSLRAEEWGGILVYGPTQGVYQVDHEAFWLLGRLKNGETLPDIQSSPEPQSPDTVKKFAETLLALGLI
jgi:hypothetical protein